MSRSGYNYDGDNWATIRWGGMLASASRGKRGQAFFRDLCAALDAMPEKKLVEGEFENAEGCVCALGAVARHRQVEMPKPIDAEYDDDIDYKALAARFDIAAPLAREVMEQNDNGHYFGNESPEERWRRIRSWAASMIRRAEP